MAAAQVSPPANAPGKIEKKPIKFSNLLRKLLSFLIPFTPFFFSLIPAFQRDSRNSGVLEHVIGTFWADIFLVSGL